MELKRYTQDRFVTDQHDSRQAVAVYAAAVSDPYLAKFGYLRNTTVGIFHTLRSYEASRGSRVIPKQSKGNGMSFPKPAHGREVFAADPAAEKHQREAWRRQMMEAEANTRKARKDFQK